MWEVIKRESKSNIKSVQISNVLTPDKFNHFFIDKINSLVSSVASANSSKDYLHFLYSLPRPSCSFSFKLVNVIEVEHVIRNMKTSKCEDVYGLNSIMLKLGIDSLSVALTHVINSCILESVFPAVLKLVKVIPIHKKGSISDYNSFRPISLVPLVSKIFEKVLNNQLMKYFEDNNLFNESQYGYRMGMGTVKATMALYANV